jgi:chromosome partitioning protein
MTAAHGLGWPGQPGQEGDASGDEVPLGAGPAGLGPAFSASSGPEAAGGEWPGDPWPRAARSGGEPGDAGVPAGPDGLGWPSAAPPPSPAVGLGRGGGESDVIIPVVAEPASDTPIARAARAALTARSGGPAWPRPRACRIITIANQKGGVGKTTTAVNLAASLSLHGSRVLVIDLDPQGNASTALDVDHRSGNASIYNVLVDGQPLTGVVRPVAGIPQLYCAPATIDLAGAEIELVPLVARESRLVRALAGFDSTGLDYIFIDCPPSLGLLTVNALVAAPEVLIPIQCEYYALEGLEQLLRTVDLVRSHLNPSLTVSTILLTMYDARTRLASQVADEVRGHFGEIVLRSIIPRSVRVSEAPSYGQSVITYDPGSSGAQAYLEAAREMAHRNAAQT